MVLSPRVVRSLASTVRRHQQRQLQQSLRTLSTIIHKAPHAELDIPHKTFWQVFEEDLLSEYGPRNATICGLSDDRVTFDELAADTRRVAAALAQDGVKRGDVVLLHSINCLEYPMVVLAVERSRLTLQGRRSSSRTELSKKRQSRRLSWSVSTSSICTQSVGHPEPKRLKCINEVSKRDFETFSFERIDPHQTVLLPFSSGTTGKPKGVALTAKNMVANTAASRLHRGLWRPHAGCAAVLPYLRDAAHARVAVPRRRERGAASLEPEPFLNALSKYKITKANIAPPIAIFLAHHPLVDKYDLSATKFLVSGGAPMGKGVEELVKKTPWRRSQAGVRNDGGVAGCELH
ncbi:hypothetical protein PINS_up019757 [Pythium insidiosum]|nr:hypothetical protein PINS_up019757 [Pythium insidiosum]